MKLCRNTTLTFAPKPRRNQLRKIILIGLGFLKGLKFHKPFSFSQVYQLIESWLTTNYSSTIFVAHEINSSISKAWRILLALGIGFSSWSTCLKKVWFDICLTSHQFYLLIHQIFFQGIWFVNDCLLIIKTNLSSTQ